MRTATITSCLLVAAVCVFVGPASHMQERGASEPEELWVHNEDTQCPQASFRSIQNAIDSARPGDTIHVCRGEYAEQIVVKKSVKLVADAGATLIPNHMIKNASSLTTGEPLSAAILVSGAQDVEVLGFTVDGTNNTIAGCAPKLIGILFQNASGKITSNSILHMRLDGTLSNCQSGNAIEVQSGAGGHSDVDIHDNAIDDFQMNAITGNGQGTHVGIDENEITTGMAMRSTSQNAIQIGFGADGVIENNTIAADLSPDAPAFRCASNAVGVLVFQSDGVLVAANSIEGVDTGILVAGNRAKISGNNFSSCSPVRAIAALGDANEIVDNELPGSGVAKIFIRGRANQVRRNRPSGSRSGVLELVDPRDNFVSENTALAVAYASVQEASPTAVLKVVPSK